MSDVALRNAGDNRDYNGHRGFDDLSLMGFFRRFPEECADPLSFLLPPSSGRIKWDRDGSAKRKPKVNSQNRDRDPPAWTGATEVETRGMEQSG